MCARKRARATATRGFPSRAHLRVREACQLAGESADGGVLGDRDVGGHPAGDGVAAMGEFSRDEQLLELTVLFFARFTMNRTGGGGQLAGRLMGFS
jgi:hypothetical protein